MRRRGALTLAILISLAVSLASMLIPYDGSTTQEHIEGTKNELRVVEHVLKIESNVFLNGKKIDTADPFGPMFIRFMCDVLGCHPRAYQAYELPQYPQSPSLAICYRQSYFGTFSCLTPATLSYDEATNSIIINGTVNEYAFNVSALAVSLVPGYRDFDSILVVAYTDWINLQPGDQITFVISLPPEIPVSNLTVLLGRVLYGQGISPNDTTIRFCHFDVCGNVTHSALVLTYNVYNATVPNIGLEISFQYRYAWVIPIVAAGETTLTVANSGITVLKYISNYTEPAILLLRVEAFVEDRIYAMGMFPGEQEPGTTYG